MSDNPFSDAHNPYEASLVDAYISTDPGYEGEGEVSAEVHKLLLQTKPWVHMISILGFIAAIIMLVGGFVGGISMFLFEWEIDALFIGVLYIACGVLYGIPSFFLRNYALQIKNISRSQSASSLHLALKAQKSFWKFVGILLVSALIIFVLAALGSVVTVWWILDG